MKKKKMDAKTAKSQISHQLISGRKKTSITKRRIIQEIYKKNIKAHIIIKTSPPLFIFQIIS